MFIFDIDQDKIPPAFKAFEAFEEMDDLTLAYDET